MRLYRVRSDAAIEEASKFSNPKHPSCQWVPLAGRSTTRHFQNHFSFRIRLLIETTTFAHNGSLVRKMALSCITTSRPCLLNLPAELRNRIYSYVFPPEHNLCIDIRRSPIVCEPALLTTCHQIRHEALPVFYGETEFACVRGSDLKYFLAWMPVKKLRMLRRVKLFWVRNAFPAFNEVTLKQFRDFAGRLQYGHIRERAILYRVFVCELRPRIEWANRNELDGTEAVYELEGGWIERRNRKD